MAQQPVAAIVVDYRAGAALARAIASLAPQVAELIVIDNASDPPSERFLAEVALPAATTVIRNHTNRGFAAACNQGIAAATQPYLLFFNPDAAMPPGGVAQLLALLEAQPRAGMVGPKLVDATGSESWAGRRYFPSLAQGWQRLHRRNPPWPGGEAPQAPLPVPAISGAAMLVRRRAVAEVGVWDEGYFLHGEDLDWCWRFHQAGWSIWYEPRVEVYHAQGGCSHHRPLWVEWQKAKGIGRFLMRHTFPGWQGRALAPILTAGLFLWWGVRGAMRAQQKRKEKEHVAKARVERNN